MTDSERERRPGMTRRGLLTLLSGSLCTSAVGSVAGDTKFVRLTGDTENTTTSETSVWEQQQKLSASAGTQEDQFGADVAVSGDTLMIGTRAETVEIFRRSDGDWSHQQTVGATGEGFGSAVAIDDDTALIGAPQYGTFGAAYVYELSDGEWSRTQMLTPDLKDTSSLFGSHVALARKYGQAVVAAPTEDLRGGRAVGSVYFYTRSDGNWSEERKLIHSDWDLFDQFGRAVDMEWNTVAVGMPSDGEDLVKDAGAVYVMEKGGDDWFEHRLTASIRRANDEFGSAVALAGEKTLLVGAPNRGDNAGAVYVFERTLGSWQQQQTLTPEKSQGSGEERLFGLSVATDGEVALIGAVGDASVAEDAGAVYVFRNGPGGWTERGKLSASDGDSQDQFGAAVALSEQSAFVGATGEEEPHGEYGGAAYVFGYEQSESALDEVIRRERDDGVVYQTGWLSSVPDDVTPGDQASVTGEITAKVPEAETNVVFGVVGYTNGTVLSVDEMQSNGSGSVRSTFTVEDPPAGRQLVWTFYSVLETQEARQKFAAEASNDEFTSGNQGIAFATLSDGPSRLGDAFAPPTDPNGDGTYEDINGDGKADIVDVNALYRHRESSTVANNTKAFDFDGSGSFSMSDVRALWQSLK